MHNTPATFLFFLSKTSRNLQKIKAIIWLQKKWHLSTFTIILTILKYFHLFVSETSLTEEWLSPIWGFLQPYFGRWYLMAHLPASALLTAWAHFQRVLKLLWVWCPNNRSFINPFHFFPLPSSTIQMKIIRPNFPDGPHFTPLFTVQNEPDLQRWELRENNEWKQLIPSWRKFRNEP